MARHRAGRFFQRWGLLLVVGLVLCGAWSFIVVTLNGQQANLVDERQRQLVQLNSAVAQQTAGLLRYVEINLRMLDRYLSANPAIDPRHDAQFIELVDMLHRFSNGLIELRMVSSRGELHYMPSKDGTVVTSVQDRTIIKQLAAQTRQFFIGEPIQNRMTKKWEIPISWRLEAPVAGVHPWLPFTWVVRAMRASLFGAFGGGWWYPVAVVAGAGLAALVATAWVGRWRVVDDADLRPAVEA